MSNSNFYVYIMTNENNSTVYIGVTNDINRRVYEHKHGLTGGFTKKYNLHKLVYVEHAGTATDAIAREKQLKGWKRERKNQLVNSVNPEWKDLYSEE